MKPPNRHLKKAQQKFTATSRLWDKAEFLTPKYMDALAGHLEACKELLTLLEKEENKNR